MWTPTIVSDNFLFLRAVVYKSHDSAVKHMKPYVNSVQLTEYCRAEKTPTRELTNLLENHLGLPLGWFERDVLGLSKMTPDDIGLVQILIHQPDDRKNAIRTLLAEPKVRTDVPDVNTFWQPRNREMLSNVAH